VHDTMPDPPRTRRSALQQPSTRYVGLDVDHDASAVASVVQDHGAAVVSRGHIGTRPGDLDQLIRRLPSTRPPLGLVDAAGPGGDWRDRDLTHNGHGCWVVAPALLPPKPGDRVKTTRRDAINLARLLRSGDLRPVDVPTGDDEARRELCRAREEARRDLKTAQVRLHAVRLRPDSRDPGRAPWGPAHRRWLSALGCPTPAPPLVVQASVRAVTAHTARRQRRAPARHEPVHTWRLPPVGAALQRRRGVQCTVAVPRVAALGDRTRVDHPRPLMRELGLIPSDSASGDRRRQAGLTQAGHTQARRVRLDGAWASRDAAKVSRHLPWRLEPRPKPLQDRSWTAPVRLGHRSRRLIGRGQHPHHVVVAIARALRALIGAMAREGPLTPATETVDSPASVGPRV
jgi:transposase